MQRSFIRGYLAALTDPAMAPMALRVALVVGTILLTINHAAALTQGNMTKVRWFSALITDGVPYAVNIHGQYVMRADSGK